MVQKQIVLQVVTLSHREEAKLWFLKPCLSTHRLSQQLSLFNAGLGNKGPRASKPFSHLRKWNNGSKIRVNENIIQYLQNVNMSIAKMIFTKYCWHNIISRSDFPTIQELLNCTKSRANVEKEMATHSSILAWRILWTEEPDWLLSIGSHRVGHDWSDLACTHAWEKEMATHSSIPAWRIPGTEEPAWLPSVGSHRIRHDRSDWAAAAAWANVNERFLLFSHSCLNEWLLYDLRDCSPPGSSVHGIS